MEHFSGLAGRLPRDWPRAHRRRCRRTCTYLLVKCHSRWLFKIKLASGYPDRPTHTHSHTSCVERVLNFKALSSPSVLSSRVFSTHSTCFVCYIQIFFFFFFFLSLFYHHFPSPSTRRPLSPSPLSIFTLLYSTLCNK